MGDSSAVAVPTWEGGGERSRDMICSLDAEYAPWAARRGSSMLCEPQNATDAHFPTCAPSLRPSQRRGSGGTRPSPTEQNANTEIDKIKIAQARQYCVSAHRPTSLHAMRRVRHPHTSAPLAPQCRSPPEKATINCTGASQSCQEYCGGLGLACPSLMHASLMGCCRAEMGGRLR